MCIRDSAETVRRVYRIMAARLHPDNTQTGNMEKFLQLKKAYEVLSDPQRREAYDASHQSRQDAPMPIFESKDFVEGMDGEMNRRLGVLSLLYHQRRVDEAHPGISVLELEKRKMCIRDRLWQLTMLSFVDVRFRPSVQVTEQELRDYFEKVVKPVAQAAHPGESIQPEDYRQKMEETLTGNRADQEMDLWLRETRKRTDIVYHEEAFQ